MNDAAIERLRRIRHLALDMDGTIYLGSRLFECTRPFLERLGQLGLGHSFLTNNSSRSGDDHLRKLARLGLPTEPAQLATSTHAAVEHLRRNLPDARRLFVLGTPSMQAEMGGLGFVSCEDEPDAVLVGFDMTLSYERLCRAAWWISRGKPFLASHPDLVCPTDQPTVLVDCGAICRALETATGVPPVFIGKPSPRMLDGVFARHGLQTSELAMVGDRLSTDIALARAGGVLGVLVLSGEATRADAEASPWKPDLIVEDIGELGHLLAKAKTGCAPAENEAMNATTFSP